VPAGAVVDDRRQDPPHVGVENAPGGQKGGVLRLERVGHVVALERIVGVEQQRRDRRAPGRVGDAQHLSAAHPARPGAAAAQDLAGGLGIGGDAGCG